MLVVSTSVASNYYSWGILYLGHRTS